LSGSGGNKDRDGERDTNHHHPYDEWAFHEGPPGKSGESTLFAEAEGYHKNAAVASRHSSLPSESSVVVRESLNHSGHRDSRGFTEEPAQVGEGI
jgi:hypothetical protein